MRLIVVAAFVLLGTGSPVAHHSFAAEYDGEQPVTVKGTVARIDWTNPHIHFYVDVTDAAGVVTQWKFEGYPPNMLVRQGWKRLREYECIENNEDLLRFERLLQSDPTFQNTPPR